MAAPASRCCLTSLAGGHRQQAGGGGNGQASLRPLLPRRRGPLKTKEDHIPKGVDYLLLALCGGLGVVMLFWRARPNLWMGVRLPWTLADREIWDKSWRLAAVFLVGMGLGAQISWHFFVIATAHLIILGILYPLYLYRRKYGTLKYWKDVGWCDYHPVVRCANCGHLQKLADAGHLSGVKCENCGRPCRG